MHYLGTSASKMRIRRLAEISVVNELMVKSKEFKSLLINPQFTSEEREKVIKQICREDEAL